jgi:uncharacterized membrane protein
MSMNNVPQTAARPGASPAALSQEKMEVLLGYFLMSGVLVSVGLISTGLVWHFAATGGLRAFNYELSGMNLFQLLAAEIGSAVHGQFQPRLLVNTGIAALMLTPYLRVVLSVFYFMVVLKNWKYTVITSVVLVTLTFSLFIR